MLNFYHDCYVGAAGTLRPFLDLLRGHPRKGDRTANVWTPELIEEFDMAKNQLVVATALKTTNKKLFKIGALSNQGTIEHTLFLETIYNTYSRHKV